MSKVWEYYLSSPEEQKIIDIRGKWFKKYESKKYDKLIAEIREKIYLSKIVISISCYQKLNSKKVLLELFIVIKELSKKRIKKEFNIEKITIKVLERFGFKKTSLKIAIKELVELEIIDYNFGVLTLKRKTLRIKKEQVFVIKSPDVMKVFLLYGLKTAIMYLNLKFKSKKLYGKKISSHPENLKIYYQTAYYSIFGWNRFKIYKLRQNVCDYLDISYNDMFLVVRKRSAIIKEKTYKGFCYKKFVGWEFSTKVHLIKRI